MGRIDQVLVNYWPTNPAKQASAQELIDCFVIKCNDYNKLWQGTSAINNQVMLSGLTRDGLDATNAVSWSMLSALDRLNMPNPQIAVRLHDYSPPDLLHEVCRLWQEGRSQIAIYNDDVFVPALQGAGIDASDARDYAIDACQDVLIFGKSDFFMAGIIGMTDILLQTMSTVSDRASWQTFLSDYKKKLVNSVTNVCNIYNEKIHPAPNLPAPLLSVSLDNCIETALDFGNGGLAICDKGIILAQPVTMINSLAALRTVVYEQGTATLSEVCKACNNNWVGYEELRRKLWNAPKWGNDDDNVDFLGADIFRFTSEEIWKHRLPNGSRFLSGIHQAHHIASGSRLNATPDGRRKGEAIPPGLSPANGTAHHGPTAVVKSVTKIDPMIVQWNSSLSMQFLPSSLCNGQGLMKFERLIRTWLKLRGPQLQVNVVSRRTLQLAQADPDNYRDLIVRVWGFCDRFVSLSSEYQDELIERTQYNV
jgi:formate C-acetyltransferase